MKDATLRNQKTKLYNKRKYNASKLKDKYELSIAKLSITLPYSALNHVPVPDRYYVRQLIKLGFTVQLSLVSK
jgi:hypothetical protein